MSNACGLPHDGNFDWALIKEKVGKVDTIAYVGALCGYEAAKLHRLLGAKRTVAIEASPANYLTLISRGCHEGSVIECVLACVSNSPYQLVSFYINREHPYVSSTLDTGGEMIRMPPTTLENIVHYPDLVVIDSEGTPIDVMESMVQHDPRAIIVETEKDGLMDLGSADLRERVYKYLKFRNYELVAEWPGPGVPQNNSLWLLK